MENYNHKSIMNNNTITNDYSTDSEDDIIYEKSSNCSNLLDCSPVNNIIDDITDNITDNITEGIVCTEEEDADFHNISSLCDINMSSSPEHKNYNDSKNTKTNEPPEVEELINDFLTTKIQNQSTDDMVKELIDIFEQTHIQNQFSLSEKMSIK